MWTGSCSRQPFTLPLIMHKYKLVPRQEGGLFKKIFFYSFMCLKVLLHVFHVRLQVEPEDVAVRQLRSVVPWGLHAVSDQAVAVWRQVRHSTSLGTTARNAWDSDFCLHHISPPCCLPKTLRLRCARSRLGVSCPDSLPQIKGFEMKVFQGHASNKGLWDIFQNSFWIFGYSDQSHQIWTERQSATCCSPSVSYLWNIRTAGAVGADATFVHFLLSYFRILVYTIHFHGNPVLIYPSAPRSCKCVRKCQAEYQDCGEEIQFKAKHDGSCCI